MRGLRSRYRSSHRATPECTSHSVSNKRTARAYMLRQAAKLLSLYYAAGNNHDTYACCGRPQSRHRCISDFRKLFVLSVCLSVDATAKGDELWRVCVCVCVCVLCVIPCSYPLLCFSVFIFSL
jgi:hypothetical protein